MVGSATQVAVGQENRGCKTKIVLIDLATTPRPQATGRGRGGVNPSPGTGDWRFGQSLYTLVGPEGLGGF